MMRLLVLCAVFALFATLPEAHQGLRVREGHRGNACEGAGLWDSYVDLVDSGINKLLGKKEKDRLGVLHDDIAIAVRAALPKSSTIVTKYTCRDTSSFLYSFVMQGRDYYAVRRTNDSKALEEAQRIVERPEVSKAIVALHAHLVVTKMEGFSSDPSDLKAMRDRIALAIANLESPAKNPSIPNVIGNMAKAIGATFKPDMSGIKSMKSADDVELAVKEAAPRLGRAFGRGYVEKIVNQVTHSRAPLSVLLEADKDGPLVKEAQRIVAVPAVAKAIQSLNRVLADEEPMFSDKEKLSAQMLPETTQKVIAALVYLQNKDK